MAARLTFRPVEAPERFVSGSFEPGVPIYIPALKDFSLDVSADGYKNWSYASEDDPPQPLRLTPGADKRLDIELQPLP